MSSRVLLRRYIRNSEKVLSEIMLNQDAVNLSGKKVDEVVEYAKRYLSDAKYYGEQKQVETGLISVAYCEGLLDALRLLGLVEFTWPDLRAKE